MSGTNRRAAGLFGVVAALLMASAPPPAPTAEARPAAVAPGAPAAQAAVRVGMIGTISDSGALIGLEKGYYQEEGIDVSVERFDTGPAMIAPLAAGQIEVASPTADPSTFNAAARGIPLRIVADKGSMPPGFGFNAVLVRKDLADSGAIRDWADLRGRRVAYLANGTTPQIDLALALERSGLSQSDVTTLTMPFPDMNVALSNGALDVAFSIEPFVAIAVTQGIATRWKGLDELYPGQQVAVLTYGPRFVADNPDVARRFMVGYLRAVRYYNDAFVNNDPVARAQAIGILTQHTAMRDPALYDRIVYPYLNPNGYVNVDSIKSDFEWFRRDGQIQGSVDVDTVIDHSFVDYALGRLGRYE
jgi:NitT/TauT family transport system substrate-binding protein